MSETDQHRLRDLLQQWQAHTLPPHLHNELLSLLERADLEHSISEEMKKVWDDSREEEVFQPAQKVAMLNAIITSRQPRRITYRQVIYAAMVLGAMITGVLLYLQPQSSQPLATNEIEPATQPADVKAPDSNKAILTLSDGRQIILENEKAGKLITEGNINVVKSKEGQLVYTGNSEEVKWNTLSVPKGSKPMQLTLSDGSIVTVNVASSITFPTAFTGNSRHVTMTGEAYFEVAQLVAVASSGKMPFIVTMNNMSIEVKGTKFNVNAYEDEGATKTTLVEGAVNVVAGQQKLAMVPGEQAIVKAGNKANITLKKNGDVEEAMAWINGKFRFHNADVETVMRQVARWYDIQVKFVAKPSIRFGGQIDRNSTLRQMFTILESSGLNVSLSDNVVTVMP